MNKTPIVIAVLVNLVWSCGAAGSGLAVQRGGAIERSDRCSAYLIQTQQVLLTILNELPRVYGALAGVFSALRKSERTFTKFVFDKKSVLTFLHSRPA
jgi:hypothetical protein